MSPLEESLKKQLRSLKAEFEAARAEIRTREQLDEAGRSEYFLNRELYKPLEDLEEQIRQVEKKLEVLPMREAVHDVRRAATFETAARYSVFVLGAAAFISLAFIFRGSTLAAIPLLGLVVLIVLWPVFEKFRNLDRVTAVFRPGGVDVTAAASNTDDFLRLQGELARKKVELQLATVDREIEEVRHRPLAEFRTLDRPVRSAEPKERTEPIFLGPPESGETAPP